MPVHIYHYVRGSAPPGHHAGSAAISAAAAAAAAAAAGTAGYVPATYMFDYHDPVPPAPGHPALRPAVPRYPIDIGSAWATHLVPGDAWTICDKHPNCGRLPQLRCSSSWPAAEH